MKCHAHDSYTCLPPSPSRALPLRKLAADFPLLKKNTGHQETVSPWHYIIIKTPDKSHTDFNHRTDRVLFSSHHYPPNPSTLYSPTKFLCVLETTKSKERCHIPTNLGFDIISSSLILVHRRFSLSPTLHSVPLEIFVSPPSVVEGPHHGCNIMEPYSVPPTCRSMFPRSTSRSSTCSPRAGHLILSSSVVLVVRLQYIFLFVRTYPTFHV